MKIFCQRNKNNEKKRRYERRILFTEADGHRESERTTDLNSVTCALSDRMGMEIAANISTPKAIQSLQLFIVVVRSQDDSVFWEFDSLDAHQKKKRRKHQQHKNHIFGQI